MRAPRKPGPLALVPLLLCGRAAAAGPPAPARAGEPVTLALEVERTRWYVGETLQLRCVIGLRPPAAERLVPLFRRPLELPFELVLPFLADLDCLVPLALDEPADPPQGALPPAPWAGRLVFDGRDVWARGPVADPTGRELLEVRLPLRVDCPGELELAGARLRYALAESYRDDPISGRVPVDPREDHARAEPLTLELLRLPERDRPPGFAGAIGHFELEARAEPRDLVLGEALRLTVLVRGEGNLADFAPPRLDWAGFTLLGSTSSVGPGWRTITYDLRVDGAQVRSVPAFELPCFRPAARAGEPPGYGVLSTRPITLLVRSPTPARAPHGAPTPAEAPDGEPVPGTLQRFRAPALVALALAAALAFLLRSRRGAS